MRSARRCVGGWRPGQVFLDNSSIELGRPSAEVITDAVRRCDALIALIGRGWGVVDTLPLFADVVMHADPAGTVRLQGLFRGQARELADHLRS